MMARFMSTPEDIALLKSLLDAVALARSAPFTVDLWKVQNLYYEMLKGTYLELQKRTQQGDEAAAEWAPQFVSLGQQLLIRGA